MMTLPHGSRCRDKNPTRINSSVVLAYTAGITFTLASAGTNLTYALSKADTLPQQLIWGSVAVAASIALALAPSAVMASLQARRTGAAILAIIAMLVFGVYSVTSALGSATGVRPVGSVEASDVAAKRKQAQAAIATAQTELATIGTIRPSATIQAEIDGKLATRRDLDDCAAKWLSSSVARSVCIEVHALRAEKAKSDRKTELEAQVTEARATLAELKASKTVANTDAVALQGFMAALGANIEVETINRLLVVLAVLTIELGGGLAIAVAGAFTAVRITEDQRESLTPLAIVPKPQQIP